VTEDVVERLHFNTAIAAIMELVGGIQDAGPDAHPAVLREAIDTTLRLLAPFVPHIASELWEVSGHPGLLDAEPWPVADQAALVQEVIEVPVQVNGKLRGRVTVPADAGEAEVVAAALADAQVRAHLGGRPVRKQVVVPGRMVNLVV
jgi:leucyl-tRNA synthetase